MYRKRSLILKVSLNNNTAFTIATGVNILFCVLLFLVHLEEPRGFNGSMLFLLEFTVFFCLLLVYLIKILAYLKESNAIIASFTILTCLIAIEIIGLFIRFFGTYLESLGVLTQVLGLLAVFRSFQVKNPMLASPFRVLGVGGFMLFLPKLIIPLFAAPIPTRPMAILEATGMLVCLLGGLFILKRMSDGLKAEPKQPIEALGNNLN